jgi:carbonic anhydrase
MIRTLLCCAFGVLLGIPAVAQESAVFTNKTRARDATGSRKVPSADEIWAELMFGNKRFVAGTPKARNLVRLRTDLAKGQHPRAVVLACSDSRVSPEVIFDQSLGDLFVVRSAGNIADAIGIGSIEYAAEHLGSSVLVVLGHTKCGAVTAACSKEKMPSPNLQAMVDKINPAVSRVGPGANQDALIEAAIQENVHESARDILSKSAVLRHFIAEGKLAVFEVEYDLNSGEVIELKKARR